MPGADALTPTLSQRERGPECTDEPLDFSFNGNVIGPPPDALRALLSLDVSRYPDRDATLLRCAIADRHGVPMDHAIVGNGSTELIWAVARGYLAPGRVALVVGPTYGEYAVAAAATGAAVRWVLQGGVPHVLARTGPMRRPERGHPARSGAERRRNGAPTVGALPGERFQQPSVPEVPGYPPNGALSPTRGEGDHTSLIAEAIAEARPHVVWLCHPNNPTGAPFPVEHLGDLMAAAPRGLFVVDEAYLPLCDDLPSSLPLVSTGRVVVLRSMTKDAALAGLRLGYAVAHPHIVDVVRRVIPPWSVSSAAQAAGLAALADREHGERARKAVAAARAHLTAGLRGLGLHPYPSVANFVLVDVGDRTGVTDALRRHGCIVRDCASFGLPACIRIGVRPIEDQERLLAALGEALDR